MGDLTLRDQAHVAVKAAEDYEKDKEGVKLSADERAEFGRLTSEAAIAVDVFIKDSQARDDLKSAGETLRNMGITPPPDPDAKVKEMAGASGITLPTGNMTLGDAFVASEAYGELLKNKGSNGHISDHWSGQTSHFEISGSLMDGKLRNLVTTGDLQTGGLLEPTVIDPMDEAPLPRTWLRQICDVEQVSGAGWKYTKLIAANNAADFVAESTSTAVPAVQDATTGYKPESSMQWAVATGTVETVAHWVPITRQAAARSSSVVNAINRFLLAGLEVKAEDGMLNGNGTSPQLRGIFNTATPYTNMHSVSVAGGNRFAAILAAMGAISTSVGGLFSANAIVINPLDWNSTEFLASVLPNGNWQFGGPAAPPANLSPWGLRPVITDAVPQGTQLIGDFNYALIGDAQSSAIYFADQHADFFVRNILVLLAEMELGFEIRAEQAFAQVVV